MLYCGIEYHKKYSVVSIQNAEGQIILERRVEHNNPFVFKEILEGLGDDLAVVYESGLNWTWLYEVLKEIGTVKSITLANAYKVRLIAEAQIKPAQLIFNLGPTGAGARGNTH